MRPKPFALLFVLPLVLLLLAGCGGGGDADADMADDSDDAATETPAAPMEPAGTASISGTINFTGTAPEPQPLRLDRECQELHDAAVNAENVVVNDNGTLKYAFVYVKEGLGDRTFPTPTEPVVFDQTGCMYKPHVFGVQTGQPIQILNSDPLLHNIHALPEENRPFNFGMPNQGDERMQEFRTEEIMVRIKCDVHPWMGAWAGVLDHPYFSTTGDDGTFSIDGLPAGTYTIEVWHETLPAQTMEVTVADGEAATADFSFGDAS